MHFLNLSVKSEFKLTSRPVEECVCYAVSSMRKTIDADDVVPFLVSGGAN